MESIRQTFARRLLQNHTVPKNSTKQKPNVLDKSYPIKGLLCISSLYNERTQESSTGFEENGMSKHARLELVSIE